MPGAPNSVLVTSAKMICSNVIGLMRLSWPLCTLQILRLTMKGTVAAENWHGTFVSLRRHSSAAWFEGVVTRIRPNVSWAAEFFALVMFQSLFTQGKPRSLK